MRCSRACSAPGPSPACSRSARPRSRPSRCTRRQGSRRTRSRESAQCSSRPPTRRGWRRSPCACGSACKPQGRRLQSDLTAALQPPIGPWAAGWLEYSAARGHTPREPAPGGPGSELWHRQQGGGGSSSCWCTGTVRSARPSGSTRSPPSHSSASACTPPSRRSTPTEAPCSARRGPCRAPCIRCHSSGYTCPCTGRTGRCACSNGSRGRRNNATSRTPSSSGSTAEPGTARCNPTVRRLSQPYRHMSRPQGTARRRPTSGSNGRWTTGSSAS